MLGQHGLWLRAAGTVGALAIVAFCLVWFAAVAYRGIIWLTSGSQPAGDVLDALGIVLVGVPFGLVMLSLNARAAILGLRSLRRPAVS